jgi:pimeloyl-ACP methyl ester carboxylesterase
MGLLKNSHGVYVVRKAVPTRLQKAVAKVLGGRKAKQSFLQRSLGTKVLSEAKIAAKPILIEFDSILARATASLEARSLQTTLSPAEIKRLAEHHYATRLGDDDAGRREGSIWNAKFTGEVASFESRQSSRAATLQEAKEAYAKGDLAYVKADVEELLSLFAINLDRDSRAYRTLSLAVLEQEVNAFAALSKRLGGEVVETPKPVALAAEGIGIGGTLSAAFKGWEKERSPSPNTLTEYSRAIALFKELHGDMAVSDMRRNHAREFREALQLVPRHRAKSLKNLSLPQLAAWGEKHPDAPKIAAPTINKLIGGVQAVAIWGHDKGGMVPDDFAWADPFARTRLEEDDSDREPFDAKELECIFSTPVFTKSERPVGGKGEAAFWLPILALFTSARRSELAGLTVDAIAPLEGQTLSVAIAKSKKRGTRLKTKTSQRTIPLHPAVISLGFADYVGAVKAKGGTEAWLFPEVAPDKLGAGKAWTKWFSRYIRAAGVTDTNKVFHSFRHNFKDALRAGGVQEDVIDALTGHSNRGKVNRSYGAKDIVRRFGAETLIAAIAKAKFEVDFSGVVAWRKPTKTKRS